MNAMKKSAFLYYQVAYNQFKAIPDLVSRIKKMEILRLETNK